jgi:hypothetical protein
VDAPVRLIDDQRGERYGEVLAMFSGEDGFYAEVFGTQMLNDCPDDLWQALDAAAIAEEMGAIMVKLNGPRYWMLDGLGTKVAPVEPIFRDFGGITMRRIATIALGHEPKFGPYEVNHVNRGAIFFFDAGAPVYELVRPDGTALVMQARCTGIDAGMSEERLANLGEELALPDGWSYRVRILDEELIVDTSATIATVTQDEFENTYTLPF